MSEDVGFGGDGFDLSENARLEEDAREGVFVGRDGWIRKRRYLSQERLPKEGWW